MNDILVDMAKGDDATRKTPALVFAFNRDECWSIAEQLKGLDLMSASQKTALNAEIDKLEWPHGVGPKLKQMLRRGVGVHHAGLLPKYRREIERLFEKKLLSVALCTETLAAGINLPARSVVLTALVKGPFGKEKLIDASTAHQIFGRAGRPQFDTEGHVFAAPHEDDVRIVKWKKLYDQIPDDTKDPQLIKKKKELQRKKPTRNTQRKYWSEGDFEKLQSAPPARLYSKGPLPWRMLAYLLKVSPDVDIIRTVIRKRLLDQPRIEAGLKQLNRMLMTLHTRGFVTLEPEPPPPEPPKVEIVVTSNSKSLDMTPTAPIVYEPIRAVPTEAMEKLLVFRACHPIYGAYLVDLMAMASAEERLQLFESILEIPRPLLKLVRVPFSLPQGPLATEKLDPELIARGLMVAKPEPSEEQDEEDDVWEERPLLLAEKARMLFDATHPDVTDVNTTAVWAAGALLQYNGNFNQYVTSNELTKQEGIIFRHALRLILLLEEFAQLTPPGMDPTAWQSELKELGDKLTESCRQVDPTSTEETIKKAHAVADVVRGEDAAATITASATDGSAEIEPAFGAGVFDE